MESTRVQVPMAGMEPAAQEEKKVVWPRDTQITAADNGFVLLIGCQKYVHEGTAETLMEDLQRYFSLDETIAKKYGYNGSQAFLGPAIPMAEDATPIGMPYDASPVFHYAQRALTPDLAVYSVNNGTITLDHKKGTAVVSQRVSLEEGNYGPDLT